MSTHPDATPALPGSTGSAVLVCPECRRPAIEDHNSFRCDFCRRLWPKGSGHELYVREVPCPDCYGGHFRPCNVCGDSGVALLKEPNAGEAAQLQSIP